MVASDRFITERMTDNDPPDKDTFVCEQCGDSFSTKRGKESHIDQIHGRPWQDEALMHELYVERGMSAGELADKFDTSGSTMRANLQRYNIEIRSTQESHRLKAPAELRDEDKLRELYDEQGLTDREIADKVDVSQATVTEWRHRHGIDARVLTGEDHWNWDGGPESIYYGDNWNAKRKEARERDDNTCQVCGYESDGRNLDVHHIQPIRTFDTPEAANTLDNLLTLCRPCHRKWEGIPLRPQTD